MKISFHMKKYIVMIIRFLELIIPKNHIEDFLEFIYPKYKGFVRGTYNARQIFYLVTGNKEGRKMVQNIHKIMPFTFVGIGGLEATYKLAKLMNEKGRMGNFVELGVARGGCAALMAMVAFESDEDNRQLWLFDSFEGLPEPTNKDFCQNGSKKTGIHMKALYKGSCLGQLEEVHELFFEIFDFPRDKVFFVKGWFQDTLPKRGKEVGEIAILRIDGDWYESTMCCLEYFYDQVVSEGAVIIDDYQSCIGCKRALDEFIAKRKLNVNFLYDGRGGCYFIKP